MGRQATPQCALVEGFFSTRPLVQGRGLGKKAPRTSAGRFVCRAKEALLNFDKLRIAGADHPLRIYKAVHVNRDPTAVHEYEVRISDQPEMTRPVSLDEELFRMPPKTEHFAVTRLELLHVHPRGLIHVRLIRAPHVSLVRARTCPRLIPVYPRLFPVYVRSATLNVRLSTHICARLRLRLWLGRLLRWAHLLCFRRRSSLRFLRLSLRRSLLLLRCLAYGHEWQRQRRYRC